MSLPSRTQAQLFIATVDLAQTFNTEKFDHWKDLIDQGGRVDDTLTFQNPRFNKQIMLSPLEVMFSCWHWRTLAKGIPHLPWISTSDLFFQNIAHNFQEIDMSYPLSKLQVPFEVWFSCAKRGIEDMHDQMQYGQWGPWETLMYRSWERASVQDVSLVMEALQTLPKIHSTATLKNLHNVATMGSVQNIQFGGIMALTVGLSPDLYASDEYQKLSTFIQNTPETLKRWTLAQEAYSLVQQKSLMEAVGQTPKSKSKSTRKI